jgi:hypothetical protein
MPIPGPDWFKVDLLAGVGIVAFWVAIASAPWKESPAETA